MVDPSPLADLRDIHLPQPVSAWPPGPIYYALLGLCMMMLLLWIKRAHDKRITAPKREALLELTQLETHYQQHHPKSKTIAANITALLRRVALVYYPRANVAGLHGEAWLLFLKQTSHHIDFDAIRTNLLNAPFNPASDAHGDDLTPLFSATRRWITQRKNGGGHA
jgi:hypothetical protein